MWPGYELLDSPHLSFQPGGFLLGQESVHESVPAKNATMLGSTVIHWDNDNAEALGLCNVGLFGLGALMVAQSSSTWGCAAAACGLG